MGKIFGISSVKINLFPSLNPYKIPAPILTRTTGNNRGFVKSLKPYVAENNAQRYYFRKMMNPNSRHLWKTKLF
ncbi:hypothetical protein J6S88_00300 [bacterium]|nr:hypothetical protein [bacterium]